MTTSFSAPTVSMQEQLKGFTAVELSIASAKAALTDNLKRFGPVSGVSLEGIEAVIEFLAPLKSFTTRYAGIEVGTWCYLLTDMKGENCYVDGYALSRLTGCRAIGITMLPERRELQVFESGKPVREVLSLLDVDRWYFRESGNLQSFEDATENTKHRKKYRLSVAALMRYFERYTHHSVPDWKSLTLNTAIGLERSIKDVQVEIIRYKTSLDL
jgi:hypothetical protein